MKNSVRLIFVSHIHQTVLYYVYVALQARIDRMVHNHRVSESIPFAKGIVISKLQLIKWNFRILSQLQGKRYSTEGRRGLDHKK